jgi:hypothetical protein
MRNERITIDGIFGKKNITVHRIDDTHTNPYRLALRKGFGVMDYSESQLKILREEGEMKPFEIYEKDFDKGRDIEVEFDNNALVLIEIE